MDGAAVQCKTRPTGCLKRRTPAVQEAAGAHRYLAYYVVKHGFGISDCSHGLPYVRTLAGRLKVGKYCTFSEGVTFVEAGEDALVEA